MTRPDTSPSSEMIPVPQSSTASPAFDVDAWQTGIGERDTLEGTCFEPYFGKDIVPSENSTTTAPTFVDGFSVRGRMEIYKFLIYVLDEPTKWNTMKNFWKFHWLWGYAAQLDWQHRSGRLSFGDTEKSKSGDDDRISIRSWWGFMNFCFSVCILLGAEKAGLVQQGRIKLDKISNELVESNDSVRICIDRWADLFRAPYQRYKNEIQNLDAGSEDFNVTRFEFQKDVWKAHTDVIVATVGYSTKEVKNELLREMLHLMPEPEQRFGLGWCRMVELLASLTFPTHLKTLMRDGAGYLPTRIVTLQQLKESQTNLKHISLCDRRRLESIEVTHKLLKAPSMVIHLVAGFYGGVVQTPEIAESMPKTILTMTSGTPIAKFQQMIRLLTLFIQPLFSHLQPKGFLEWSMAVAIVVAATLAIQMKW